MIYSVRLLTRVFVKYWKRRTVAGPGGAGASEDSGLRPQVRFLVQRTRRNEHDAHALQKEGHAPTTGLAKRIRESLSIGQLETGDQIFTALPTQRALDEKVTGMTRARSLAAT